MLDKEKVVNEFEQFVKKYPPACADEEYEYELFNAVLELLKEQEAEKKCCRDCEYYGACHDE